MAERGYYVSNKGLKRLYAEKIAVDNDFIETQRLIGETTSLDNDLRENPEYLELALKVETTIPKKRALINDILSKCKNFEESYKNKKEFNVVSIGDKVFVHKNDKDIETFIIGGYGDSDIERKIIAYNTPLAKAFMGKKLNEKFVVHLPGGSVEYEILLIQRGYPLEERG